jgi:hypothetical protein
MLRKLLFLAAVLAVVVPPALAETASKDGTPIEPNPGGTNDPSPVRADWVYNTGGSEDFVPDLGGSDTGWGEWFITTVQNDAGTCLHITEFGFPCCGPPTGFFGWILWYDVGGINPPTGPAESADEYGEFTPVCTDPDTWPPTVYTYVDVSGVGIVVPAGNYFCFGYDNTGMGGQTYYNGVQTWAWYGGMWDADEYWGRTAILQVKANFGASATQETSWGGVKALFQ